MQLQDNAQGAAPGNDDARPAPGTDQQAGPTAPSAPEATPAASTPADDADLTAHRALLAAAEAEERGEARPPAAAPSQPSTMPAAPPAPPAAPRPGPVPYERFVETTRRLREAEAEAQYLRGVTEALRERPAATSEAPPAPGQQPPAAPTAPPPADPIAEAERAALEAAEKFDRGEITATELSRAQMAAARAIADASVEQRIATRPAPGSPGQGSMVDEILVQRHADALEAKHPALTVLTDVQMNSLVRRAHEDAALAGKPYGKGPLEDWRLREHVAQLATAHIPIWGLQVPQNPAPAASSPPPPARPSGLSPTAEARLRKMEQASGLPPDTASMGAAPGVGPAVSEAAILGMSDDEIAERMPASVRRAYLTG